MIDLAVVILTHNEERHIARALDNVAPLARQIFVVDSFSDDATVALARARGATVLQHRFLTYAAQFEWALAHAPIATEWVMRLDADEYLTPELLAELRERLPRLPPHIAGVNLKRRHVFLGREIRHGGRYPLRLLRIWRRGAAVIERRWMDEHMTLLRGQAVDFTQDFVDHNLNDLTYFTDKHNRYATREALDVVLRRRGLAPPSAALTPAKASPQAALKRWIKHNLYDALPLGLGPAAYFVYRYGLRLGFLDGREGLIYHALQAFWYRFLVGAKVGELERALAATAGEEATVAALSRLTGHDCAALAAPIPGSASPAH